MKGINKENPGEAGDPQKPFSSNAPPDDPLLPAQWYLNPISAFSAWDKTRGDTGVIVAVVDIGVDLDHPDLGGQVWVNRPEWEGDDGVDDDGNGFVDDINGWDFYDNDNDPRPQSLDAHGTHVAGIVAAATDNGYGMAGVGWRCKLMPLRAGVGTSILRGYEAIVYAAEMGAKVINISWGGETPSNVERIAIEYAHTRGSLVVAAAGNITGSSAPFPFYPAAYPTSISVAALDGRNRRAPFSNYGPWVSLSAPGSEILSLSPQSQFAVLSGTSMAAPIVAGAAALVWSIHPHWSPEQVKWQLLLTADPLGGSGRNPITDSECPDGEVSPFTTDASSDGSQLGYGRLNLARAVWINRGLATIENIWLDDTLWGNGDGIMNRGETVGLKLIVRNHSTHPLPLFSQLTSLSPYIEVVDTLLVWEPIPPSSSLDNRDTPLRFTILPSSPASHSFPLSINLTYDGLLFTQKEIEVWVDPVWQMVEGGNFIMTATNFGAYGYYDIYSGEPIGVGFRYPKEGLSALFHGSIMVGSQGRVSDNAYGNRSATKFDFEAVGEGWQKEQLPDGLIKIKTRFTDLRGENPVGVSVDQTLTTFSQEEELHNVCLIEWELKGSGTEPIESLYVGIFLDWDIVTAQNNIAVWDTANKIAYTFHPQFPFPFFGAAFIDPPVSFASAIPSEETTRGWDDRLKWGVMTSGFTRSQGDYPRDWAQLIGTGPFHLGSFDSLLIRLALAAAPTREGLFHSFHLIRNYNPSGMEKNLSPPPQILLYPQPANEGVMIQINPLVMKPIGFALYDLQGRLHREPSPLLISPAPTHFPWRLNLANYPSGLYILVVKSDQGDLAHPLIIAK